MKFIKDNFKTLAMINKQILFYALIIFITSCVSNQGLYLNLTDNKTSLSYLHDTEKKDLDPFISIGVNVKSDSLIFQEKAKVNKISGWCVPLLFINIWDAQKECMMGQEMIKENVGEFIKGSIEEDFRRSGLVKVDSLISPEYNLLLTLEEIKAVGPYRSQGFAYMILIAYGFSFSDVAGPAKSELKLRYKLTKGDQVILKDDVAIEGYTKQLSRYYKSTSDLQLNYGVSMVESLGINIKKASEKVVEEVNSYLTLTAEKFNN